MPIDNKTLFKFVCVGCTETNEGKLGHMFVPIAEDEPVEEQVRKAIESNKQKVYTKLLPHAGVGMIYNVLGDSDLSHVYPNTARYVERMESSDYLTQLAANDMATRKAFGVKKLEKKESVRDLIAEHIEPLRTAYLQMSPTQKAAMQIMIVRQMQLWNRR